MKKFVSPMRFLLAATLLLSGGTSVVMAQAQKYPVKPIRMVLGFSAGTSTDVVARLIAESVSPRLGQQFIVENRPGGSATIAANYVAKSAPDGYTMVIGTPSAHATVSSGRTISTRPLSMTLMILVEVSCGMRLAISMLSTKNG